MSTWSPASILNLKMNTENEGAAGRIYLFILKFGISKWKNGWRMNWLPAKKYTPLIRYHPPSNQEYFELPQKHQIPKLFVTLVTGACYVLVIKTYLTSQRMTSISWKNLNLQSEKPEKKLELKGRITVDADICSLCNQNKSLIETASGLLDKHEQLNSELSVCKNVNKHLEEKVAKLGSGHGFRPCLSNIARGIILNWQEFWTQLETMI